MITKRVAFGTGFRFKSHIQAFFMVTIFFYSSGLFAKTQLLPDTISSLWTHFTNSADDSSRVMILSKLSFFYQDYMDDPQKSDSLASVAVQLAIRSKRPVLIMAACNYYIESIDNSVTNRKAIDYAELALQISIKTVNMYWRWRTTSNLARVRLSAYEFKRALILGNQALALARGLKIDSLIVSSLLLVGKCYESNNQKIEAFRNYHYALNLAEKTNDLNRIKQCYSDLSSLYITTRLLIDAIEFKKKEEIIARNIKPLDSTALMWIQCQLFGIEIIQQGREINEDSVVNIIRFAVRTHNERLKTWMFAIYRRHLLELNDITKLYKLYNHSFPNELARLRYYEPDMYFRLQGYFTEYRKQPDSAIYMFNIAEQLIADNPARIKIYQAHFYNRFGELLIRHGHHKEAIGKFTQALRLSELHSGMVKYLYMQVASENLERLYLELGDYKNAWYYASTRKWINDSLQIISNKAQVKAEEVVRERERHKIIAERDQQKIRQGKTQRNVMAGVLCFLLILSYLVYRNYRNQKRLNRLLDAEKKKSDDLLLNILPVETAEELKQTGAAKAKRFEEVTVMFTDFKDFTLASENMSAEELVTKIHFYFSAFDRIISAYPIEKIKIIGDSYMCAAGLPVPNKSHALDIVHAALELQAFMAHQKKELIEHNESVFELRIGIHTGPVVAGIVGLNKFAYDIWGDTVNTASRLESSGEIDKVNISGSTYELVKDHFRCTYRGKVNAKNKGEIDMYFVEATGT